MIKKMKIRMEFGDAAHPLLIVEKIFLKRDRQYGNRSSFFSCQ